MMSFSRTRWVLAAALGAAFVTVGCGDDEAIGPEGAGPPAKVAFSVQPTSTTAGAAISPAVEIEVRDANDNLVTDSRATVTLIVDTNPGGGSLEGTTTVNAVNGIASFSGLSIDKAGTGYSLTASSGTLTEATSNAFDNSAAVASKLEFSVQPPDVDGNDLFTAEVRVMDAFGNVVPTATDPISVEIDRRPALGASARLLGTTTVTAVAGVASFTDLRIDVPGADYALSARSGALTGAGSAEFQVSLTFVQIDAGSSHTCGVTANGSAYCWGNNDAGQLGIGNLSRDSVPRLVTGGLTFAQVSAGVSHTCGVTTANASFCWGTNSQSQLGIGLLGGFRTEPVQVSDPAGGPVLFVHVSAGRGHTCAATSAAGAPSDAYCWGDDGLGQVGDNTTFNTDQDIPTLVSGGLTWKQISASDLHTCAIEDDNTVYCWGANWQGAIGIGNQAHQAVPVQMSGLTFADVTGGLRHSCGRQLSAPYEIRCWGRGLEGEVGDGAFVDRLDDVPIVNQLDWTAVVAGDFHTCMIDSSGQAYCTGLADEGQLGNGTNAPNLNVRDPVLQGALTFDALTLGERHTCALNATTGEVWCWGRASDGQLGDGTGVASPTPVQIVQ